MTDVYSDGDEELKLMEAELDLELERQRKLGAEEPATVATDATVSKDDKTPTPEPIDGAAAGKNPSDTGNEPAEESTVFEEGVGKFL
jgi:hypothetical protein